MCVFNEAGHHQVGPQGECSGYQSLGSIWDSLVLGPHNVIANIVFFGRAIFLVIRLHALSSSITQKLASRFLSLLTPFLGPESGGQGLWAGSSLAALLDQRGVIMQLELYLPSSPIPALGTAGLEVRTAEPWFLPLPAGKALSKGPFLSLSSYHLGNGCDDSLFAHEKEWE